MSTATINSKTLDNLRPALKPYYLRDTTLTGFGVRVYPSGKIMFIPEVWYDGRQSHRKSLGAYPIMQPQLARLEHFP